MIGFIFNLLFVLFTGFLFICGVLDLFGFFGDRVNDNVWVLVLVSGGLCWVGVRNIRNLGVGGGFNRDAAISAATAAASSVALQRFASIRVSLARHGEALSTASGEPIELRCDARQMDVQ